MYDWLSRGFGQIIAPDENAAKMEQDSSTKEESFLLSIVAPDPKFAPPTRPPSNAFKGQVLCEHCNKWTTVGPTTPTLNDVSPTPIPTTPISSAPQRDNRSSSMLSPNPMKSPELAKCEEKVLSTARNVAYTKASPRNEDRDKVFRFCGNSSINEALQKKLRKILKKNPHFINAKAVGYGDTAPDGFTPLHAAIRAGNVAAVKILLEFETSKAALHEVNMEGRSVLHIASEGGHGELIEILTPLCRDEGILTPPPVDLIGRTPLGVGLTSPQRKARTMKKDLERLLFSPEDPSIYGEPKPDEERMAYDHSLMVASGTADMPGRRVEMEDACCVLPFQKNGKPYCLAAVCDGHGDQGKISNFVADNVLPLLQDTMAGDDLNWEDVWTKTCLKLDAKIKGTPYLPKGGSTAVMALITENEIIVANVGDSRAILIQSSQNTEDTPSLKDEDEVKSENDTSSNDLPPIDGIAIAMSEDHKPELQNEKLRIEEAGLKVIEVKYTEEDGEEVTVHKVERGTEKLAMSRSFGDFDFKSNKEKAPEEQAVSAVPDVVVRRRDHDSDQFLVLACDGIWDVMNNNEVKDFLLDQVKVRAGHETVLPDAGDALTRKCFDEGSEDNMTTVILALSNEYKKISRADNALDLSDVKKTLDLEPSSL